MTFNRVTSKAEEIIEEARNGRMFILVDDEDRENEGDLVIPAQMATPDAINFMAKYGRGLICLALDRQRVEELKLPLMPRHNNNRHQTAFTVSIEAREGVTTGISASDRARTIAVAIDPHRGPADLATPGHVFPLAARDGGVLERAGHTEAAVDVARLAGLNPSGVICEIMNDDGTMARRPELIAFAQQHGLKIGTIADLIAYRRWKENLIERTEEGEIDSRAGGRFKMIVFRNKIDHQEHFALVKGDIGDGKPVLTRVHALGILDDLLDCNHFGRGGLLRQSMRTISYEGRGVIVAIRPNRMAGGTPVADELRLRGGQSPEPELRDYGIGAQILLELGVKELILLSNSNRTLVALEGYGIKIAVHQRIDRETHPA
jgi:3,4-dihydroxy 2-butanone 4-phosphate synthase/GTP cyclohydrolase II